jgi:hypothetical protein
VPWCSQYRAILVHFELVLPENGARARAPKVTCALVLGPENKIKTYLAALNRGFSRRRPWCSQNRVFYTVRL